MDVYQARLTNLQALIEREGEVQRVADKIETAADYLSQITSTRIKRQMGAAVARRIERAYHLPRGWMDQPHRGIDADVLALAEKIAALSPARRAAVQALIDSMNEAPTASPESDDHG